MCFCARYRLRMVFGFELILILLIPPGVIVGILSGLAARGGLDFVRNDAAHVKGTPRPLLVTGAVAGAVLVSAPLIGGRLATMDCPVHPAAVFGLVAVVFGVAFGLATFLWLRPKQARQNM